MKYVVDASVAVEYLLRTTIGRNAADILDEADLMAPELLDVEVLSILRRGVLKRELAVERASLALEDLMAWPIDRISHRQLVGEAWQFRHNISAYDAIYVATARLFQATLLTADGPLSRAPIGDVVIRNLRTQFPA